MLKKKKLSRIEEADMSVNIYDENDVRGITCFINKELLKKILYIVGVIVTGIPIYEVVLGAFEPSFQRPVHILLMYIITLIIYPSGFFKNKRIETLFNISLILILSVVSVWSHLRWTPPLY